MAASLRNLLILGSKTPRRVREENSHLADFVKACQLLYQVQGDQGTAMLRVTVVESSRRAVTLRVEGRITGSFVEELRRACDVHTFAEDVQLSLELADVSFADAAGIVLLKELRSRGVGLMRANTFMAEQLKFQDGASSDEI